MSTNEKVKHHNLKWKISILESEGPQLKFKHEKIIAKIIFCILHILPFVYHHFTLNRALVFHIFDENEGKLRVKWG